MEQSVCRELPVYLAARRVGTLWVSCRGDTAALRAVCTGVAPGLYRLTLRGDRGTAALGVTETGDFRRSFSRELLAPAGTFTAGELCPCDGAPGKLPLPSLPPEAVVTPCRGGTEAVIPWREGLPFPLPEFFCFARVEPGRVRYLFDCAGRPTMPKI